MFILTVLNSDAYIIRKYLQELDVEFNEDNYTPQTTTFTDTNTIKLPRSFRSLEFTINAYDIYRIDPYLVYHLHSNHQVMLTKDLKLEGSDIPVGHTLHKVDWEEQEQRRALFKLHRLIDLKE